MNTTNYDLDTEEGMRNSVEWTRNHFNRIKQGGVWLVPRSGSVLLIDHKNKGVHCTDRKAPDPSIKRVVEAMGWTYHDHE